MLYAAVDSFLLRGAAPWTFRFRWASALLQHKINKCIESPAMAAVGLPTTRSCYLLLLVSPSITLLLMVWLPLTCQLPSS
jgi:hypothetical protein